MHVFLSDLLGVLCIVINIPLVSLSIGRVSSVEGKMSRARVKSRGRV
jgi:hypothetical protein